MQNYLIIIINNVKINLIDFNLKFILLIFIKINNHNQSLFSSSD